MTNLLYVACAILAPMGIGVLIEAWLSMPYGRAERKLDKAIMRGYRSR